MPPSLSPHSSHYDTSNNSPYIDVRRFLSYLLAFLIMSGRRRNYSATYDPDLSLVNEATSEAESAAEHELNQLAASESGGEFHFNSSSEEEELEDIDDQDLDDQDLDDQDLGDQDLDDQDLHDQDDAADQNEDEPVSDTTTEITRRMLQTHLSPKSPIITRSMPKFLSTPDLDAATSTSSATSITPPISRSQTTRERVEAQIGPVPVPQRPPITEPSVSAKSSASNSTPTTAKSKSGKSRADSTMGKVSAMRTRHTKTDSLPEISTDTTTHSKSSMRSKSKTRYTESFAIYIHRMMKTETLAKLSISREAVDILDSFIFDMFGRICQEAWQMGNMAKMAKRGEASTSSTLSASALETAVRLVFPGELGRYAIINGREAVKRFEASLKADREMKAKAALMGSMAGSQLLPDHRKDRQKKLWMTLLENDPDSPNPTKY